MSPTPVSQTHFSPEPEKNTDKDTGQAAAPVAQTAHLSENPSQTNPLDAAADTASDLAAQLQAAQAQVVQAQDELLRARAEVENIRRRAADDVSKARKFGTEAFAENLLAVRDSLEAALAAPEQSVDTWREGVEVTLRQLTQAFERNALKELAPEAGEKFDPNLHQAISTVPSEHPQGTVAQRLQKGYALAERVLRPALVMVSSGVSEGISSGDPAAPSPGQG